ncbi:hypothetical protein C8R43DRAFT_868475 [Mycena crocata]|nr:hypothetical protein C8R43DRAFT_868475 [Mycena crocata]
MLSALLVIVPFFAGINAANDWTKPCTSGQCSYDLPAVNGSASGTLKIWGSENAITDITKAAGWQILGCDSNALSQDIRLVCMNDDDDPASGCAHLYQNIGAVNKIVRLPEDCGGSAFARISKAWVPENQDIPAPVRRRLVRRAGVPPVVKALALDTDFDKADWSQTGMVHIAIQAANVPGAASPDDAPPAAARHTRHAKDKVKDVAKEAADKAKDAADKVADKAKDAGEKVKEVAKDAGEKVADKAKDVATKTFDLKPLTFNKAFNLIDTTIDCGKVGAGLRVDMDTDATAQASITVAATGTLVPPKMTSFGVVAGLTANIGATMTMTADVSGRIDSGKINLVTLGVPGLSFPGILTVGPSFKVDARVVGEVDLTMDMIVGLNYDVTDAQLSFPPRDDAEVDGKAFAIGDTPLTLSADPSVTASGSLTAHLIPSLNLGVSALGNKAKAQIFLALDTNAALTMNLDGSASATKIKEINNGAAAGEEETGDEELDPTTIDNAATGEDATGEDTETTKTIGGCVRVNGGINVKAGVEGSFFGLFNQVKSVSLFNKNFKIFEVRPLLIIPAIHVFNMTLAEMLRRPRSRCHRRRRQGCARSRRCRCRRIC